MVREAGYEVVWQKVLPDDQAMLEEAMKEICDEGKADLLLTTGGTGFSPRDVMPEATLAVAERMVPGIPEAMRANTSFIQDVFYFCCTKPNRPYR